MDDTQRPRSISLTVKAPGQDIVQTMRRALASHQQGRLDEAERLYGEALSLDPNIGDAWHFLGVIKAQRGDHLGAIDLITRALTLEPKNAAAHYNLANSHRQLERWEDAIASFDAALKLKPDHIGALNNRGAVLEKRGRYEGALDCYDLALRANSNYAQGWNNRGNVLAILGRPAEALAACDRALELAPNQPDTLNNRGNALRALNRPLEALEDYDRALAIESGAVKTLNNRGTTLMDLGRYDDAFAVFDAILASDRRNVAAWCNRAVLLMKLRRFEEAVACYDEALELGPPSAELLYGKGYALIELKRNDEAVAAYDTLFEMRPDHPFGAGMLLFAKRASCDWKNLNAVTEAVRAGIRAGKPMATPYAFVQASQSEDDNLSCAKILTERKYPAARKPLWTGNGYAHQRIRVAYLSADFRRHPVTTLLTGVLEQHDRARFEIIGIGFGAADASPERQRLVNAFENFYDMGTKTESDIAAMLAAMEADIAVDLTGFTGEGRTGIFALKPAPVQVNYLGYPATMAASYYDYILADEWVAPAENESAFSESVVRLPGSYMPCEAWPIADRTPARAELGLPESGFVFASFNNAYKFSPETFDVWMRLLQQAEGSVLWLAGGNKAVERNLRREAERRWVAPERIVFAPFVEARAEHLARLKTADLFLDTLPVNAHTTACDALWAGLPLLTCPGKTFAGRVAASLLNALDMPELIAPDMRAYEAMAVEFARDPQKLRRLRETLWENRGKSPLFDPKAKCRALEAAFATMHERRKRGLHPAGFVAAPRA